MARKGDGNHMKPEEFCNAVREYVSSMQEFGSCEDAATEEACTGAQLTKKEFEIAKRALLAILNDSGNSATIRLRAAENLAALASAYEQQQWFL